MKYNAPLIEHVVISNKAQTNTCKSNFSKMASTSGTAEPPLSHQDPFMEVSNDDYENVIDDDWLTCSVLASFYC